MPVRDLPVTMMAAPSLVRVTADHLALIRALITAGQTTRALELLDSVWHPTSPEEQCWYLRLWVLVEEGRAIEALDLARVAVRELPGSSAIAYLHAALEQAQGSPVAARHALERARLLAADAQWTPQLASLLASEEPPATSEGGTAPVRDPAPDVRQGTVGASTLSLAAQLGAGLLFPLGSARPLLPVPDPRSTALGRGASPAATSAAYRRFGLVAAATVAAALWAIRDPVPAFFALAAMVVLMIRVPQRS